MRHFSRVSTNRAALKSKVLFSIRQAFWRFSSFDIKINMQTSLLAFYHICGTIFWYYILNAFYGPSLLYQNFSRLLWNAILLRSRFLYFVKKSVILEEINNQIFALKCRYCSPLYPWQSCYKQQTNFDYIITTNSYSRS